MRNGNVLRFARVIGFAVLLLPLTLAACGDDEESPADAGGSGGAGGGNAPTMDAATGLGDNVAGKACASNTECSGGNCADAILGTMVGAAAWQRPAAIARPCA